MSDKKQNMVGVKLNDLQVQLLDKLIETGKAKHVVLQSNT